MTIITKPVTPEYEEAWDRIFGKKYDWRKYPKDAAGIFNEECLKERLNQPVFKKSKLDVVATEGCKCTISTISCEECKS